MIDLHKLDKFRLKDREREFTAAPATAETVFSRCMSAASRSG